MSTKQKTRKRNATLDLRDYDRSRRAWKPDWEALEADLKRSNVYLRRKNGKPHLNP